jgi:hypothetical protein
MKPTSEERGRQLGRNIAQFFISIPRYIIAFFLPFIVFVACIVIFNAIDTHHGELGPYLVLSSLILALAYYYKK